MRAISLANAMAATFTGRRVISSASQARRVQLTCLARKGYTSSSVAAGSAIREMSASKWILLQNDFECSATKF